MRNYFKVLAFLTAALLLQTGFVAAQGRGGGGFGLGGFRGGYGGMRSGYAGPLDQLAMPPSSSFGSGYYSRGYSGFYPGYSGSGLPFSGYLTYQPGLYGPLDGPYGYPSLLSDNRARFRVHVPAANAEIWLEGKKTSQTGLVRDFVTPPLTPGYSYPYHVRVRWLENGKKVEQTQTIYVRPNRQEEVNISRGGETS